MILECNENFAFTCKAAHLHMTCENKQHFCCIFRTTKTHLLSFLFSSFTFSFFENASFALDLGVFFSKTCFFFKLSFRFISSSLDLSLGVFIISTGSSSSNRRPANLLLTITLYSLSIWSRCINLRADYEGLLFKYHLLIAAIDKMIWRVHRRVSMESLAKAHGT